MLYDDDDHDLFLTPQFSCYSASKGGASRHMIVNGRSHRIAVKMKCSNNHMYRVSPVYCNLEPGQSVRLQIVRDAGEPGTDKIVVIYRPSRYHNPRDAFKKREGKDDSDIRKKVIGLIAKYDTVDNGIKYDSRNESPRDPPPPIPESGPPLDNSPRPPPPLPFARSFSEHRRRPPRVPTSAPPPIGMAPPLVAAKSIRRKPPPLPTAGPPPCSPPLMASSAIKNRVLSVKRRSKSTAEPPRGLPHNDL